MAHISLLSAAYSGAGTYYSPSIEDCGVSDFVVSNSITAPSGTNPTFDVDIQDSPSGSNVADASAVWYTALSMTQQVAAAGELKAFSGPHFKRMRTKVVIGGTDTPGATFDVSFADKKADRD